MLIMASKGTSRKPPPGQEFPSLEDKALVRNGLAALRGRGFAVWTTILRLLRLSERMRILLVDDHEIVRRGLRNLLETQEHWLVCGEAEDGEGAVEKTKALRPDVVILDVSMPRLNGFGAAKLIRELFPETPILLYSMHYSRVFVDEARRIGVTGYVSKSEDAPTFLMAVDAVQHHRPFFSA